LQALFFNQIKAGAKTIADKTGAALQIVSGNDDSVVQANAIDNLIANSGDAIVVDAIGADRIKPSIRKAAAAGIPIVTVDGNLDDPAVSTQVGTANTQGGAQIGEKLLEISQGTGTVGIVSALNSIMQLERQKGFTDLGLSRNSVTASIVNPKDVLPQ
jgi:ribose transport system substrate-binding protein